MTAILAFASLGVDLARVQLAKTELQAAADTAALHAANNTGNSSSTANNAIAVAAENTVDGTPLVLTSADAIQEHGRMARLRQEAVPRMPFR